jgi:hypothetical protein
VRATPVPRGTPTGGVPTRTQNAPAGWRLGALLERGASSVQRNPGLPSERFDVLAGPLGELRFNPLGYDIVRDYIGRITGALAFLVRASH